MNFEFIATYVELQDIPSYSTNITVEGQLLKLSFLWNERIGKRVLSIKNTSDVVYLQNTILHPNEPLELNSNAVLDDLPYSVTLVKTGDVNKVGNIFNWSKDFILCFSRTVDLDVKKLNVVYGVTTPSTPSIPPIVRPPPSDGGGEIPPSDDEGGEIPPSDDEGGEIPPSDDEDVLLYDALKSLTIEAFYIEEEAIPLLKPEYQNLTGMSGHLCNRAQFKVFINGLNIGHVNLNNEGGGQPYPRNTENNGIRAITNNGVDFPNAKYSRIDVSEEQAQILAKLDNKSLLNISLSELIPDPHHGVTWVRLSVRTESGSLVKLYDQLVSLNYKYTFDILRPELGLIESSDNSKKLKYVKDFTAKRNVDDDFKSVASGVDVSEGTAIELKVEVVDDFSDEIDIVYSLPYGAPLGVQLNGNILTVDNGVSLFKENITVGYKVTTVLDPLNALEGVFTFKLSVFSFDLSASVVYKQNGVWKSLEVGTTIPNGTLHETWDVTDVIINDKVTRIGNNCFNAKFLSLKLSNNLTHVGDHCFMWLDYISDLLLPNTLTRIGSFSFNKLGKELLRVGSIEKATLNIPTNLSEIKDGVFNEWAVGHGKLDLRNTAITTIGYSFNEMVVKEYNSIDVYLPDGLTIFDGFTYARIRKVVFGRYIETIKSSAFSYTREHYSNDVKLPEIAILRSDVVVEPSGTSPLGRMGFSAGRKLYVPTNLVSDYQASTQWAKLVSNENIIGINPDTYE